MQITRQDLDVMVVALTKAEDVAVFNHKHRLAAQMRQAIILGNHALDICHLDPVDVVPVQDYPFKLRDVIKHYNEGPT